VTRARGYLPALLMGTALLASGAARATPTDTTCPIYNPPSTLVLAAGTPQSAPLGTPYQSSFHVALAATNGCPITTPLAGVAVTFTAPASGPSGVFSASGTNAALVGTDGSGTATAPMFTANTLPGGYLVVASSALGSVAFSVVNTPSGVPATIKALAQERQSAVAGAHFARPLRAEVLDSTGRPVEGANVSFSLGAGGSFDGGGTQAVGITDASGVAISPSIVAGPAVGAFTAIATVPGLAAPARFALDALAAGPPRLSVVRGSLQSAIVGGRYRRVLEVRIRNSAGHPVSGAAVTFSLGGTGGGAGSTAAPGASFTGGAEQATATTNANGIASSPHLTANTVAGSFTATASLTGGGTVAFSLWNRAGRPAAVTAGVGASESAAVGSRFPVRLAVTVTDENGNPVGGVDVTFAAPKDGAGGRFTGGRRTVRLRTDPRGIAVAPAFAANGTAGGYVVRASAAGHSAAFALVNQPRGG
jgi:hypothetical protein